jgi:hypothetical protein
VQIANGYAVIHGNIHGIVRIVVHHSCSPKQFHVRWIILLDCHSGSDGIEQLVCGHRGNLDRLLGKHTGHLERTVGREKSYKAGPTKLYCHI